MTERCTLICCRFDRERANNAPGRRNLRPLYSPVAVTRDAASGGTTSSALTAESAPEPRIGRLGSRGALGTSSLPLSRTVHDGSG